MSEEEKKTVKITLNGKEYEVEEGKTVLQAALDLGVYIPHYCYHPHLSISGNCRMCLVDIKPGPPKLSIACSTRVAADMVIETETEKVQEARRAVMEFLLKNHPIDCPICDQAGECWLQDYYMGYDTKPARVEPEEKVKKRKNLKVGKTLVLDTERCILCGRCVRFMREIAGDDCLVIKERRDHSEISLFPGKTIDSPYSLCLADICPVGAWTGADFRFKQRVWFLDSIPSVCPECGRGCNIWIDHRRGEVFRIRPRANEDINKSWMCDEGRLAYHAINDIRLLSPSIGKGDAMKGTNWEEALSKTAEMIKEAGAKLHVILSAKLSVEEGKAAQKLFGEKLGGKLFLHTGEEGWEDDLLHRADQNANTKGLTALGISGMPESIPEDAVVVVLEALCPHPLPEGITPHVVVSPMISPAVESAEIALPAASFAESAGTFVNFEGKEQSYGPVLGLKGSSLPHIEIMQRLAGTMGMKLVA